MMPIESLTDREWLPGELLSGLECSKARLVLRYEILDLFYESVYPSVYIYIHVSSYLFIYLAIYLYPCMQLSIYIHV